MKNYIFCSLFYQTANIESFFFVYMFVLQFVFQFTRLVSSQFPAHQLTQTKWLFARLPNIKCIQLGSMRSSHLPFKMHYVRLNSCVCADGRKGTTLHKSHKIGTFRQDKAHYDYFNIILSKRFSEKKILV